VGCAFAALSINPFSFLLAQAVLGMATSGMLMCPMALAARELPPVKFGLWSGLILSLGNVGMLISASPLAWAVENYGWRAGFWISLVFGLAIAAAVAICVPGKRPQQGQAPALLGEMVEVARLAISPNLRGLIAIAFVALSVMLVLRGLWGGPWLMDVKGLTRLEAGNVLFLFTLAMIVGPFLVGVIERNFGHRRLLLATYQFIAAGLFFLMAGGGPAGIISTLFNVDQMPARYDVVILVVLGFALSAQPLIYAMTQQAVAPENTGKALSAVNLAFFLGTAAMQSATDPIGARWGLPVVLMFMATALVIGTVAFLYLTRPSPRSQD
jgi:predicted MFS family arabinose efflux permease